MKGEQGIFEHSEIEQEGTDLKGAYNAEVCAPVRRQRRDILTLKKDASGGGRQLTADDIEEGRLAGAVRSDDE